MGFWKNAFHIEKTEAFVPDEREAALLAGFADRVCRHGLATPAILFLETCRPLNFIGAQGLAFFEPLVRSLFDWEDYTAFYRMLERRGSVEELIRAVETRQAEIRRENRPRRKRKA